MKTRAAVLRETKSDWSVEEIELDPPGPGEVLVEIHASGMCHSDEHVVTGDLPFPLPIIGGHEGAGKVLEIGDGVTNVAPGDNVVFGFVPSCGTCPSCSTGHQSLCDMGQYLSVGLQVADQTTRHHSAADEDLHLMCLIGTFSEHTVANEASCIKLDPDIPLDLACLLGCGVVTGWGSAVYAGQVGPGDSVAVIGVGGIGANAVQGAKIAGAKHVIAIDPVEFKRETAMELGATHTFASMAEAMEDVTNITYGRMCNQVLMTMGEGKGDMMAEALAMTAKLGTVVVTNLHAAEEVNATMSLLDLTLMEKKVVGSLFGSGNARADIPKLVDLWRAGQLDLNGLVTKRYSLDEVNEGYKDMRAGKNIRGVLVMQP